MNWVNRRFTSILYFLSTPDLCDLSSKIKLMRDNEPYLDLHDRLNICVFTLLLFVISVRISKFFEFL